MRTLLTRAEYYNPARANCVCKCRPMPIWVEKPKETTPWTANANYRFGSVPKNANDLDELKVTRTFILSLDELKVTQTLSYP